MDDALSTLYRSLREAAPGADAERALSALRAALSAQQRAAAAAGGANDDDAAERLLTCFHEALTTAGPDGMALLDALLLDAYPHLASLGAQSERAAARLLALTAAAAAASDSPRDVVTAILEAMDRLMHGGGGDNDGDGVHDAAAGGLVAPAPAALLTGLVPLLPPLLRRLRRRKAAFAAECLGPAAGAARAAGGAAGAALDGAPEFAAKEIGVFTDFLRDAAEIIRSDETAAPAAGAAAAGNSSQPPYEQQLARCALEMLSSLTLGWRGAARAAIDSNGGGKGTEAALKGEAADAVARLQGLLVDLGIGTWAEAEQLCGSSGSGGDADDDDDEGDGGDARDSTAAATGAALAALYSLVLRRGPAPPAGAADTLRLAARFGCRLASAAQRRGSDGGLEQALALVWLGARRSAAAAAASDEVPAAAADAAGQAAETASQLAPLVSLLAALMAQAPANSPLGKLARGAWAAAFDAVRPPPLRAACLGELLATQHPEACALLLQRARADAAAGLLDEAACWRLAGPWLKPDGSRGWRSGVDGSGSGGNQSFSGGGLEVNANAVCAALNLLRLLLLRRGDGQQQTEGTSAAAPSQLPSNGELRAALLAPLQEAVQEALASAHAAADEGGCGGDGGGEEGGEKDGQGRSTVPGVAVGAGTPVDAWLVLSRIDEVLGRVLELV